MLLHDWLIWNIQDTSCLNRADLEWQTLFVVLCWFIWKSRNETIFSNNHKSYQQVVDMGFLWARSYHDYDKKMKSLSGRNILSGWKSQSMGWIKLNFEGVMSLDDQRASIGRVLRDANANWLWGYTMNFGGESIFKVEAQAMLEGLFLACDKRFRKVEVKSDNILSVELLQSGEGSTIDWWKFSSCIKYCDESERFESKMFQGIRI